MYRRKNRNTIVALPVILLIVTFFGISRAGVGDVEQNPVTGRIESVSSDIPGRIEHTIDSGPMGQPVTTVLQAAGGRNPRLSISSSGHTSVVWLDDSGAVHYRRRSATTKTWSAVLEPNSGFAGADAGTPPAVVAVGSDAWIAYESTDTGPRSVILLEIIDSAEPFGASMLTTTEGTQPLDLRLFHESVHTWVAWDDSSSELAWSALDPTTHVWGVPQVTTFDPADKASAYLWIRNAVVDP